MTTRRQRRLGIEGLEGRIVLSADLAGGVLSIVGTNKKDTIGVAVETSGPHAGELAATVNGQQGFFTVGDVSKIRIFGLNGSDQITIDENVLIDAWISGGQGKDDIHGGGGDDEIHGDQGKDTIDGRAGDDDIYGDEGKDLLLGGAGNDMVHGGEGKDTILGGVGDDLLYGESGNDFLDGQDGDDFEDGGSGKDDCHGGLGDDRLKGGTGNDNLDGDDGDDLLDGDDGKDHLDDGDECDLDTEFKAILSGVGSQWAKAEYELENEDGLLETELKIDAKHLAANTVFDVILDGMTVGQLTTDGDGEAELKFSSDPDSDELAFPLGFPSIHDGSTISIGTDLQGSFVAKFDD